MIIQSLTKLAKHSNFKTNIFKTSIFIYCIKSRFINFSHGKKPLNLLLEPQEIELAADLKNGKCCILAGAGVSSSIINIDPVMSEINARTIKSTVGSWAGFLRAAATEFFKTYTSSQLPLKDINDLFEFGSYIDEKISKLFEENQDQLSVAIKAVEDAIFDRKEFSQNELISQITDDKKRLISEINVEIQRIKFIIDRVYNALPQAKFQISHKENKIENDYLDLLKKVALISWGKGSAITESTEVLTQLINKMNESLGHIPSGNLWQRGSKSVKQRINILEEDITNNQDEEAKEKLKYFKNHYTELKTLFDKFSGSTERSKYITEFTKDFQLTLAGVISINHDNLNQTFRRLTELVLSPLKSNPHSPLAKALDTICENNVLLTSNYDTFLESALYRNALDYMDDLADSNQLDFLIPDDITKDSKLHNRFVIHVHGLYYDKGTFVISEEEYKKTTSSFYKFMRSLILEKKRSLVFIGVSADGWTDWHMSNLFRDLAHMDNIDSHPRHYWVVKRGTNFPNEDDFSELSNQKEQKITLEYVKKKVKIVKYGDSYDNLAPYLIYLSTLHQDL
ncbi:966_t:CDS:2 [Dentiscutata heterogama]|uniref:966_t:CDS:1 n=1 Tax=Dentiscutata heterogama TaxID=1316150 RepID=A0ACA9KHT4_9GLOM|nr:966_t:CDS:2 [Dentiscutata heterogama]